MEMKRLLKSIEELNFHILEQNIKLESIEKRLAPLEKLNSIEHCVEVEQIELSNIKSGIDVIKTKAENLPILINLFIKPNIEGSLTK
jgi:hypothetical protein